MVIKFEVIHFLPALQGLAAHTRICKIDAET